MRHPECSRLTVCLLLLALMGSGSLASAQQLWPTVKEWDSGPSSNRLDIVILGDGYTAAEIPLFRTHVTNFINYILGQSPYDRYKHFINFWRVEVESAQSGADHPLPCYNPPTLVNTALNATYCTGGTDRCLTADVGLSMATALINVPAYDKILVLVNDGTYGGCANSIATTTAVHSSAFDVATHELGHSVHGLADEYWTAGTTWTGSELGQVNATIKDAATIASTQSKWYPWLGLEGTSAFEGCRYYEFGIYRPKSNCKMRSLFQPFCPVCREQTVGTCWSKVTTFDAVNPPTSPGTQDPTTQLSVSLPALDSGVLTASWSIDGVFVSAGLTSTAGGITTYSFVPISAGVLGTGNHVVSVQIQDPTTFWRRTSSLVPLPTRSWIVTDTFSDFEIVSALPRQIPTRIGQLFQVDDQVRNNGSTAGPSIRVGYYLSTDSVITSSDIFIGSRVIGPLAPGAVSNGTTSCRIPPTGLSTIASYRIGVIVDDQAAAYEADETDNIATVAGPLNFDHSASLIASPFFANFTLPTTVTLSLSAGASFAGQSYYLFPSVTSAGTGTDFGPYVGTAPFVFDTLSILVGSGQLGAPFFQGFQGTLDAAGQATAVFEKPALPYPGAATSVFFWFFTLDTDPATMQPIVPFFSNATFIFVF